MRQTGFLHHIGSFLLLAATVLLVITDISAPVVDNISMLRVELRGSSRSEQPVVTFGTFGYCVQNAMASGDHCSRAVVGYNPATIVQETVSGVDFSEYAGRTADALTHVMVLHPVATGLVFIAFLLSLGAGIAGSLLAVLVSLLAFLVTLVALVCDFVSFSIIMNEVNNSDNSGQGAHASWGSASWTTLASAVCSLLGMIIVFFTCCSARIRRKRESRTASKFQQDGYAPPVSRRRRWF